MDSGIPEALDKLEELAGQVREAMETTEATEEQLEKLDELVQRIKDAREDPQALNGETYGQLAVDLIMLVPENLPIPEHIKRGLEAAAKVLGALLGAAMDLEL